MQNIVTTEQTLAHSDMARDNYSIPLYSRAVSTSHITSRVPTGSPALSRILRRVPRLRYPEGDEVSFPVGCHVSMGGKFLRIALESIHPGNHRLWLSSGNAGSAFIQCLFFAEQGVGHFKDDYIKWNEAGGQIATNEIHINVLEHLNHNRFDNHDMRLCLCKRTKISLSVHSAEVE